MEPRYLYQIAYLPRCTLRYDVSWIKVLNYTSIRSIQNYSFVELAHKDTDTNLTWWQRTWKEPLCDSDEETKKRKRSKRSRNATRYQKR
jgi:hypothetical protein